jgi:hypothetical protein
VYNRVLVVFRLVQLLFSKGGLCLEVSNSIVVVLSYYAVIYSSADSNYIREKRLKLVLRGGFIRL